MTPPRARGSLLAALALACAAGTHVRPACAQGAPVPDRPGTSVIDTSAQRTSAESTAAPTSARPVSDHALRRAVYPGARVRIESPARRIARSRWRVIEMRGDTLLVVPAAAGVGSDRPVEPVAVAVADLTRLDVNRGSQRHALIGAAVGLVGGITLGALYGASHSAPLAGLCFCPEADRPDPKHWAMTGAYVGITTGTLVGRFVVGDRWERLLPRRARVSVAPTGPGGARVALTVPTR